MSQVVLPMGQAHHFPALDLVAHVVLSVCAAVLAWLVLMALEAGVVGNDWAFILLSSLILGYSAMQAYGVALAKGPRVLINPTVFYAIVGNGLMLVVGGLLYVMPDEIQQIAGNLEITYWMNYYLVMMLLANIGLWSGYRSRVALVLARGIQQSRFLGRVLRRQFEVRYSTILILVAISLLARLAAIASGVYGYSATLEGLAETAEFRQYLTMGAQAGTIALVAVSLDHFSKPVPPRIAPWLVVVLAFETFFGLLSGFKSAVVMPFLIVLSVAYLVQGRLLVKWLALAVVALAVGYAFIEPFRQFRNEEFQYQGESIGYITGAVTTSKDVVVANESAPGWRGSVAHFLGTQGNISVYAEGIQYREESEGLLWDPPEFLRDIFLAPLLAVVPRVVWEDKPGIQHGAWYRTVVLQGPPGTSIAMSPVTYLYFAGGMLAVFIGFYVFGMAQGAIFHGFLVHGGGGALVFLGLLSFMRGPDSVYYTYIIDLIRLLPLLLVVQYMTFMPGHGYTIRPLQPA